MKYINLDQKGSVLAEYIWIDGHNNVRSKTKVRHCSLLFYSRLPRALEAFPALVELAAGNLLLLRASRQRHSLRGYAIRSFPTIDDPARLS